MQLQGTLFEDIRLDDAVPAKALCHRNDPATSRKAAEAFLESGKRESHEKIILRYVRWYPGWTGTSIASTDCPLNQAQIMKRVKKMRQRGLIQATARKDGKEKEMRLWPAGYPVPADHEDIDIHNKRKQS